MPNLKIFWNPTGFELDSLGKKSQIGPPADGDTPYVRVPIRMLGIDTPETNYPGVGKPSNSDDRLSELALWMHQGKAPIDSELAQHLVSRLETGAAGSLQESQGQQAKTYFKDLLKQKLTLPNGRKRSVFLYAADEHFDRYGRLLAYMAPHYKKKELATFSLLQRATFNLLMIQSGWASTLQIFPSLPKYENHVLFHQEAKAAYENKKGAWAESLMLTGYEWRMCIKLHAITKKLVAGKKLSNRERYAWISRYCFDMTTLGIVSPQQYHLILAYNRGFVWPKDVRRAVAELNLVPGK